MAMATPDTGLLVVLEGIDGAGKTTLRAALGSELRARAHEVVETKEPTDGPIGQQIRTIARLGRDTVTAEEELELFLLDRARHVADVVLPALARGAVVLQDRSYFSTVAYQGGRGLDRDTILARCRAVAPAPHLLLVLDLPETVSAERIRASRGATDDFEGLEALRRVREVFLSFPEAVRIDATNPPAQVRHEALRHILAKLNAGEHVLPP